MFAIDIMSCIFQCTYPPTSGSGNRMISSWIPSIFWDLVFSRVLKQEMIRNWASWCCSLSSENLPVLPRLFSSCHTSGAWFLTTAITWSTEKSLKWVMVSGPWYAAFWDDNKFPICGSKQGERAEEATCSCSWPTSLSNSSIRFCITWSLICWSSTCSLSRRFSWKLCMYGHLDSSKRKACQDYENKHLSMFRMYAHNFCESYHDLKCCCCVCVCVCVCDRDREETN